MTEAEAHFNKDKAFRLWGASHGGIYVPVSERTSPNPNLAHIPERDLVTASCKQLTLMNPAYMIRQMMDEYQELFGVRGKITSFPDKLFNSINQPDEWELKALYAFAAGADTMQDVTEIQGVPHLRLMKPLYIKVSCLKCHADQGYQIGDLRGGV